ncbi:ABC transporter permease [Pseudalkalibacillus caeni]|uniref:ABC transporter permease n=1 Tax=Exobacillus caeni TaxID=2574798 RepID=A0A5R9F5K0_9BACL|nr:ABC transporter permease [Pseudalkalibacillus caeni]
MLKLIQNENMKIYYRIGTWVMVILLLIAVIGMGIFVKTTSDENDNWQVAVQTDIKRLQAQKEKTESFKFMNEEVLKSYDRQIEIKEYRLANNIPPLPADSFWGFINESSNLTSFVTLFTIVIAAGMVASEFSWGTIKLLLIRPVSRSKILLSKYLSTLLFAFSLLAVLFLSSALTGGLLFGFDSVSQPHLTYTDGAVKEVGMLQNMIGIYGLNSVDLVILSTFAFMMSSVFRSSSLAIGLSIFLMFIGPQISNLLRNYEWSKYILFANTNLRQYIDGIPFMEGMTMTFSISVLIGYFVIFVSLSWLAFTKRDVTA